MGRHGTKQLQVHETVKFTRIRRKFDRGVIYSKWAVINCKVYPYRDRLGDLTYLTVTLEDCTLIPPLIYPIHTGYTWRRY